MHIPEFLQKHIIREGRCDDVDIKHELNNYLKLQFSQAGLVNAVAEYDIYLNHPLLDSLKMEDKTIKKVIIQYLLKKEMVLNVIDKQNAGQASLPATIREMVVNGYNPQRSGDLQIITKSGVMDSPKTGMSHGVWNPYDAHIPLVFYGWGINRGHLTKETYMTDISPTICSLLHIQMPSGNTGKVIGDVIKN